MTQNNKQLCAACFHTPFGERTISFVCHFFYGPGDEYRRILKLEGVDAQAFIHFQNFVQFATCSRSSFTEVKAIAE